MINIARNSQNKAIMGLVFKMLNPNVLSPDNMPIVRVYHIKYEDIFINLAEMKGSYSINIYRKIDKSIKISLTIYLYISL